MLVPIALPERGIGQEDVRCNCAEELGPLELFPVLGLHCGQKLLRHARAQPSLVLGGVELAVGLKFGQPVELRERRVADGVEDFVVGDLDPSPRVLGLEQLAGDELVPDVVPDGFVVVEAQTLGGLALAGLSGLLDLPLVHPRVDRPPVHPPGGRAADDFAPVDAGKHEDHHEHGEHDRR
jgi:hypothetical protein